MTRALIGYIRELGGLTEAESPSVGGAAAPDVGKLIRQLAKAYGSPGPVPGAEFPEVGPGKNHKKAEAELGKRAKGEPIEVKPKKPEPPGPGALLKKGFST